MFAVPRVLALLAAGALAACGQHGDDAPPAAAQVASATPTVANGFNESPQTAPRGELPPDCAIYLAKIDACAAQVGMATEVGQQLEQSADEARRVWSGASDPAAIGEMCRRSVAGFAASAHDLGCK